MKRHAELRPEAAKVIAGIAALNRPPLGDASPDQLQAMIQTTLVANADPMREGLARVEELVLKDGAGGVMPARLYARRAKAGESRPVLLFLHGGGFMTGNLETHRGLASEIAWGLDLTVVAIDYRLAPQHKFPAAVDDMRAAMHWLAGAPAEIGHDVTGLVIAGDSAGGTLAAISGQFASEIAVPILLQWLMYAGVEVDAAGGSMESFAEGYFLTHTMMRIFRDAYYGDADRSVPTASPIFAEDFSSLPPAMVFTCECDPLRDQARAYAAKLIANGVPVRYREGRGLIHGAFGQLVNIPSARPDLEGCFADVASLLTEAIRLRGFIAGAESGGPALQ